MTTTVDSVWKNCRHDTLASERAGLGQNDKGLVAAAHGKIVYAGPAADAPMNLQTRNTDGR